MKEIVSACLRGQFWEVEAPGRWGRGDDEVDHGSVGYKRCCFQSSQWCMHSRVMWYSPWYLTSPWRNLCVRIQCSWPVLFHVCLRISRRQLHGPVSSSPQLHPMEYPFILASLAWLCFVQAWISWMALSSMSCVGGGVSESSVFCPSKGC